MTDTIIGQNCIEQWIKKPITLFGREDSVNRLTELFEDVVNGESKVVMVRGESGVGKSIMIHQTLTFYRSEQHYFCVGKFNEHLREEPYSAIKKALNNLIQQLLIESKASLRESKDELLKAFRNKGGALIQLLPELEKIIGKQPCKYKDDFQGNQNIIKTEVVKFIKVVANKRHALTIFIDDLQWADAHSLELFQNIAENIEDMNVLLIGAYRMEKIVEKYPVVTMINKFLAFNRRSEFIDLFNFDIETTRKYIMNQFNYNKEIINKLSEIIYAKTLGSPIYLDKYFELLVNEKLIACKEVSSNCTINFEGIKKLDTFEDVIQVILAQIKTFNRPTLDVLKVAVCMGSTFNDVILVEYFKDKNDIDDILNNLTKKGLIFKSYDKAVDYQFSHDKVMQAIYSLLDRSEEVVIENKIGHIYLHKYDRNYIETHILHVMHYFQYGVLNIKSTNEKIKLANYFLKAATMAIISAAFNDSKKYCQLGIQLLGEHSFVHHNELAYKLYHKLAHSAFMLNETDLADQMFQKVLSHSKTNLQKAEIYKTKMITCMCKASPKEAVNNGLEAMTYLGFYFPRKLAKLMLIKEAIHSKMIFTNKRIDQLLELPELGSEWILKVIEIMMHISPSANMLNDPLFPVIVIKGANITVKYGNSKYAIISYVGYAVALTTIFKEYKKSGKLEAVTLELIERYQDKNMSCGSLFALGAFVSHYSQHGDISVQHLENTIEDGLEIGDHNYVGIGVEFLIMSKYILGNTLSHMVDKMHQYNNMKLGLSNNLYQKYLEMHSKVCEKLMTPDYRGQIVDQKHVAYFNEVDRIDQMGFCYLQFQNSYLFGHYKEALETIEKVFPDIDMIKGYFLSFEYYYYYGLIIGGIYPTLTKKEKSVYIKKLKWCMNKMQVWSKSGNENFYHKYTLMKAEYYKIREEHIKAEEFYEVAIMGARVNRYKQNEGMANEQAGKFYYKIGEEEKGLRYLKNAYRCYEAWGAVAKCYALRDRFSNLSRYYLEREKEETSHYKQHTGYEEKTTLGFLDNIVNETDIDTILNKLLDGLLVWTHSATGHIVIENNNELIMKNSNHTMAIEMNIEDYGQIPRTIVRYVSRTNQGVVFGPDRRHQLFINDPYISSGMNRSILCLPLLFKGIFLGLIYLEREDENDMYALEEVSHIESLLNIVSSSIRLNMFISEKDKKSTDIILGLTDRELGVLQLMAEGMSNKEISEQLKISVSTTKSHLLNIFSKLEVNNRIKAVIKAQKYGFFDK